MKGKQRYYHPQADFFRKFKLEPPEAISHNIEDTPSNPLSEQIPKTKVTGWYLDGNRLVAQTELGEVINHIDSGYIMRGVDKNNLPILEKFDKV